MTPGPWYVERDDTIVSPGGKLPDVWRIVSQEARESRRRMGTSARPRYLATVYNKEDAMFIAELVNAEWLERQGVAVDKPRGRR